MIGLEERNAYLEFLQREFNFGAGLANASLIAAGANVTLRALGVAVGMAGNEAFEAYGRYRFLDIDRDAARTLVETAQSMIAQAYLQPDQLSRVPDSPGVTSFFPRGPGFEQAIQAISLIEYQCTRSGIRGLISNAAVAAKTGAKMYFDYDSGQIVFSDKPPAAAPKPPTVKKKPPACPEKPHAASCEEPK
jgi:hypothetical protein